MTEKSQIMEMEGRGERKSVLVGVSMLVLSILLAAAVSSLIYLAVSNSQPACTTSADSADSAGKSTDIHVTANVNVKSEDRQVKERVEYSKSGHIAYYYNDDGSFEMDDFGKGLRVVKSAEDKICYIIPVGTNNTYENGVEAHLRQTDGKDLVVQQQDVHVEVLDGEVTDVSFLPERAQEECDYGFKWMSIVAGDSTSEDGTELERQKRAVCYYYLYYYWCPYPTHICRAIYRICV